MNPRINDGFGDFVKFVTELSLEAKANPMWVSEGKNDGLAQIALKDPKPALIRGFIRKPAVVDYEVDLLHLGENFLSNPLLEEHNSFQAWK